MIVSLWVLILMNWAGKQNFMSQCNNFIHLMFYHSNIDNNTKTDIEIKEIKLYNDIWRDDLMFLIIGLTWDIISLDLPVVQYRFRTRQLIKNLEIERYTVCLLIYQDNDKRRNLGMWIAHVELVCEVCHHLRGNLIKEW